MSFVQKIRSRNQYRQTVRELSAMTDRELNDIGIGRGDIVDVAKGTYAGIKY